nr:hypothetical protein [Tanacetum cinerariifolium]
MLFKKWKSKCRSKKKPRTCKGKSPASLLSSGGKKATNLGTQAGVTAVESQGTSATPSASQAGVNVVGSHAPAIVTGTRAPRTWSLGKGQSTPKRVHE